MIDKNLEIIINEEIDGTASPEDSARLKQALATDEEARLYYEDLKKLNHTMETMDLENPPSELKAGILREIEAGSPSSPSPVPVAEDTEESWLATVFSPFRHLRPAYGLTFAGGLAAGLIIFSLFNTPATMDNESMSGMMAPQQTFDSYALADRAPFSVGGARGILETRYSQGLVLTKIDIDAPGDLEIVTKFDNTALSPVGYRSLHSITGEVFMGAREFRLTHKGRNSYWLVFQEAGADPSSVHVTLTSGELVYRKSLRTRGEDS